MNENGVSVVVEVISDIPMQNTQTQNGSQKTATVENEDGNSVDITSNVNKNATTQNTLEITKDDGTIVKAEVQSKLLGTDTHVKADGSIETKAQVSNDDGSGLTVESISNADGTTQNTIVTTFPDGTSTTSNIVSNIPGTDTVIASDGGIVQTTPSITTNSGKEIKVVSSISASGQILTVATVIDPTTGETKTVQVPQSEPGAVVNIRIDEVTGFLLIETQTIIGLTTVELRNRRNNALSF